MSNELLRDTEGGVARLTMNRPEVLNALDDALLVALREALRQAAEDDAVRAVLLTGAGRGFCAGADLGAVDLSQGHLEAGQALVERYNPLITTMREIPKPIVAAVNGVAAGAGMSIALAADIVVAARSATFAQAFSRIGLIPDAGSTYFVPRLAGEMRARALAMLGERISADEAYGIGLVWQVFDDDRFADEAAAIAQRLARGPTRAYGYIKQALNRSLERSLSEQLDTEASLQSEAGRSEDAREGVAAFLEKRPPRFTGR
ncbi:MAG: enoyl-CoA hydratase/isomerase family protein [Burkholderiales bacterium]|nr:MAG: enoyl-CoA hydratase/isomerase family protein [Burkholderiales bacterium]